MHDKKTALDAALGLAHIAALPTPSKSLALALAARLDPQYATASCPCSS